MNKENNLLISLFDLSGSASRPYRENGWMVSQIDIQLGLSIFDFKYQEIPLKMVDKVGIIIMMPCTHYALSGARHFEEKDKDGRTEEAQKMMIKVKEIIDYFESTGKLQFWQLENPMSRIHKLNPWLGEVKHKFNPCDYAGHDPNPNNSRYNKATWLWGNFNKMEPLRIEPIEKASPFHTKYGGKSLRTKNARSKTPLGFCYAFYKANH